MKVHVFVATTQGLVAIQNITTIDDADISSIVSINGTSTMANISSAYHNFVKKGAGIIQQDFGACSYRINIAQRIDHGNSWQLAFYLAHAAQSKQLLGNGEVNAGDQVICATGEINTTSREVHRVEEVALKQRLAAKQIQAWRKMNVKTLLLVPNSNAEDINKQLAVSTEFIQNLEQALSLLPLDGVNESQTLEQQFIQPKPQPRSQPHSQALNLKNDELTKINAGKKNIKEKLKWGFISLFIFMIFLLSINILFFSPNEPSIEATTSVIDETTAQQRWQVLLLAQSQYETKDYLQPAYSLIEKTIGEQLIAENFEVADKALLIGANNVSEQAFLELNKKEINLAIRFHLNVHQLNDAERNTWRYELSAYLVDLESKKQIETHNEYGEFFNESINCDQQCLSQWFANNARKLAQDMGAILVVKLKNLPRRYQVELNFKHFSAKELTLIHNQLKALNGFISVNLLADFSAEKELLQQASSRKYAYVSYLPHNELEVALYNALTYLDLEVTKANSNIKSLVFIRNNTSYYFYYILVSILVFALLFLACLANVKVKPKLNNVKLSKDLVDEALKPNMDNIEAEKLKEELAYLIKNEKQLLGDKSIGTSQPEHAIKLPIETTSLPQSLTENIDEPQVKATFKLALTAFENKEYYKAYSLIDKYIHQSSSLGICDNQRQKIINIRTNIEQHIRPIKGAVLGQGALANHYIFTTTTLAVGRNDNGDENSFAIGYKNISRVGKQCIFSRNNNDFYIEDQGSTNGSLLNEVKLAAQEKVNITDNAQLTLGGGSHADSIAICQLDLKLASGSSPALIMKLNTSVAQLIDFNSYKTAWPSMKADFQSRWILLGKAVSLSTYKGKIELGLDKSQVKVMAYLIYQNGFYIRPCKSIKAGEIMIDKQVVYDEMPIRVGAIISVNGLEFSLQQLAI